MEYDSLPTQWWGKASRVRAKEKRRSHSLPPPSLRLLAEATRAASPEPASPLKRELEKGKGKGVDRG